MNWHALLWFVAGFTCGGAAGGWLMLWRVQRIGRQILAMQDRDAA